MGVCLYNDIRCIIFRLAHQNRKKAHNIEYLNDFAYHDALDNISVKIIFTGLHYKHVLGDVVLNSRFLCLIQTNWSHQNIVNFRTLIHQTTNISKNY